MENQQLWQFFKDNGITPQDIAHRTSYKVGYIHNVLNGSDKLSRGFCFAILQAWPETAAFLLPESSRPIGELQQCPS